MADAFRGLTLRIGADTRPLRQALATAKTSAGELQTQLRAVQKALAVNPHNITAANQAMKLFSDKASIAARQAALLNIAMKQASTTTVTLHNNGEAVSMSLKKAANSTTEIFTRVATVRNEFNGVNMQLEEFYDHMARAYQEMYKLETGGKKITFATAQAQIKDLAAGIERAGAETSRFKQILTHAFLARGTENPFGISKTIEGVNKAFDVITRLRAQSKMLSTELSNLGKVQAFNAIQTQLTAARENMRQAVLEANRMKNALFMKAGLSGLAAVNAKIDTIEGNLTEARQHAIAVADAFDKLPPSIEVAKAKIIAARSAEAAVKAEIDQITEKMRILRSTPGFDKIANSGEDAYHAVSRLENELSETGMEIKEVAEKLKILKQEARNLEAQKPDGYEKKLEEINAELREGAVRLKTLHDKSKQTFRDLNAASAVKEVQQLDGKIHTLEASLTKVRSKAIAFANVMGRVGGAMKNVGYALMSTIGPAMMMTVRYAITAARDIDAAYRDMRKTVNGTEEEFEHLYDAALKFSQTHFTSADQILEIEAIGGQLGILPKNLETFSEVVSNLGIATNVGTEEWATYIGQLSNIMRDIRGTKSDTKEYEKRITSLSDAIVRLGNNSATQESNIMKVVMRMASLGTISGFSTPELLGIATAVAATGQGAEAAGTAISRTFSVIEKAVAGGGEDLDNFAQVADMSAEEFAKAWSTEPMEAFKAFLSGLKRIDKEGGSIETWLGKLKINSVRTKQAINGLVETFDILEQSEKMAEDAWNGKETYMSDGSIEWAGDAAREAARKAEGFSGALQMVINNAQVLASEFGKSLYPAVSGLNDMFTFLVGVIQELPDSVKSAITIMMGLGAIAPGFLVAFGMPLQALLGLSDALDKINKAFMATKAGAALDAAASKAKVFSSALFGLPLGKTIALVVALAAAIGLIAKAFMDSKAKADRYEKSLHGAYQITEKARSGMSLLKRDTEDVDTAFSRAADNLGKYRKAVEEAIDRNVKLADSYEDQIAETETGARLAQKYADRIKELAGNCEGSSSNMRILKDAISKYNDITGSSIKITDDVTGAINMQNEAIDANTNAYKLNAYNKAYSNMLQQAIEEGVKLELAYDEASNSVDAARIKLAQLEAQGRDAAITDESGGIIGYVDEEYEKFMDVLNQGTDTMNYLSEAIDMNGRTQVMLQGHIDNTTQAAKKEEDAFKLTRHSLEEYQKAIANSDISADAFTEYAQKMAGSVNGFAQMLSQAGISGDQFVAMGIDGFDKLYQAAGNDIGKTEELLNALNDVDLKPKDIVFNEEGLATINGQVIQFQDDLHRLVVGDYVFRINDDGSLENITGMTEEAIAAMEEADGTTVTATMEVDTEQAQENFEDTESSLEDYDGETYNATAGLNTDPAINALDSLISRLNNYSNSTWTATVSSGGNARGGISSIPVNASGGINGIITRATLTNVGWVGENGDEALIHMRHAGGAIIPLSNRQHVRPFAQAVAAEMHPYTGYQTQSQVTYNINVTAGSNGDEIAETITKAIRAQELMRRR